MCSDCEAYGLKKHGLTRYVYYSHVLNLVSCRYDTVMPEGNSY